MEDDIKKFIVIFDSKLWFRGKRRYILQSIGKNEQVEIEVPTTWTQFVKGNVVELQLTKTKE